jgi:hypothetical protein
MKLSQKELILSYVREYGSIIPAKKYGTVYRGKMLGSELSRRCRELRADGKLLSRGVGKFEEYYLEPRKTIVWGDDGIAREI